ncbi:MAG: general secretion pathway protein GspB [Gammaproteobacteria bacterium]|nr:general secretion pathway protein GspB [Gammaproteobacteria bacterium]MCP4091654.1 general secretion pathway protein GspB [Gammaproteobacteria bacterium]MCP4276150.1 general secretion pathway protein GspB [Gammaproteobacteria bacterium]MCP4831784.1 general secretion pathway protein GspB [Gammaproteobacteria bacterium]MCP4929720.1 general secretion pathway protein GspB [Gammaproteobacteria bacterium]
MSFILDALRKSENERQRNQTPGMANLQAQNTRQGSGIWIPLVALLVGINLSLVVVMWFLSDDKQPVTQDIKAPQAPATSSQPGRRLSAELSPVSTTPTANPQKNNPATPDLQFGTPTPDYTNNADDGIPTLAELMLANTISIPKLHLDIHVYSETPTERFVFINMSRYNEGATLSEGPKVVRISKNGVVLRYQGQDFLMVREQ